MEEPERLPDGIVYTETVVHAAPENLISEAPYQIAIIDLEDGNRRTARILMSAQAGRVVVGDPVRFAGYQNGVPCFTAASSENK